MFFKPESPEPINGHKPATEDEDETLSDDLNSTNGIFPPRDGRSVSSTLHERSRSNVPSALSTTKPPATTAGVVVKRSSSKTRTHRASHGGHQRLPPPPPGFDRGGSMSTGSSPPAGSARETFLNYFFGQNGPGPITGSSIERTNQMHNHGHGHLMGSSDVGRFVPVGRDVSGAEVSISSGLMAGKRGMDGNSAAYDMKSLGRHIEVVSKKKKKEPKIKHLTSSIHLKNFKPCTGLFGWITADRA